MNHVSQHPVCQGSCCSLPALLPIQFDWGLSEFAVDKTRCKVKVILKDGLGKTPGGDVNNKVFSIKVGPSD